MSEKVLIVEDEGDIREAMAEAIAEGGYQVMTAENGEKGLHLALTEKPDLILLDLIMPIMDGHEMLRRLRTDPWGHDVRVVILTSMDDVDNVATAHEGDVTDYIIKTHTSLTELLKQVRLALYSQK